ncbi:GIN domain-containing protein [Flagellimonas sp. S174]|uniref:GIN domain-containing protein n=1 Tax=Flagellimonas sp. S174 TaxID=3410790 RepID=UPI003BF53BD9
MSHDRTSVSFEGIKTNAPLRIILEQDSLHKIQVEAPNHLIDSVKTSLVNDTLLIETRKNVRKKRQCCC